MPRIAVFGGTGYLASLIKYQNNVKINKYVFFSREKKSKNYIDYSSLKKNYLKFKKFDFAIHILGPNNNQLKKNKYFIQNKNQITSNICDVCLKNNIKLIYISSLQVYKNYGKKNIYLNSIINKENKYSHLHYQSEEIIKSKFLNHSNMFTILRVGNVFGFRKNIKLRELKNNLIHSLCDTALKKRKILINNCSIQRTFIPSKIYIQTINLIIKKKIINNSIMNIIYKNLTLKNIADIIKSRIRFVLNFNIDTELKNFTKKKIFVIYSNKKLKFKYKKRTFIFEIDQILKNLKN